MTFIDITNTEELKAQASKVNLIDFYGGDYKKYLRHHPNISPYIFAWFVLKLDGKGEEYDNLSNDIRAELEKINAKLGVGGGTPEISTELNVLNDRIDRLLGDGSRLSETAKERELELALNKIHASGKVLTDEEKRALDYSAGYYYWHINGDKAKAENDKKLLETYINNVDNRARITDQMFFVVNTAIEHFKEETEKHAKLKEISDLNNDLSDLENKYRNKDIELYDAEQNLILKQEEKDKLSDIANKKYSTLQTKLNTLNDTYTKHQQQSAKDKKGLLAKIGQLRIDIANAGITSDEKEKRIDQLNTLIKTWEDDTLDAKNERDQARIERDQARTDLTTITTQKDTNIKKINDETIKLFELSDKIKRGLIKLETLTIGKELDIIISRLKA